MSLDERLKAEGCKCTFGMAPGGRLYGVNMGPSMARLSTHPRCPIHALCQGYTKAYRAAQPSWSKPYCPAHATRNCDEPKRQKAARTGAFAEGSES